MFSKKRLEELLASHRLMPIDLAEKTKIEPSTISRILNGETAKPRAQTVNMLEDFFRVEPSHFFSNDAKKIVWILLITVYRHSCSCRAKRKRECGSWYAT